MEEMVDKIIEQNGAKESALLAVLMDIQGEYNYLPRPALELVSKKLGVSMSRISYMATFFTAFSFATAFVFFPASAFSSPLPSASSLLALDFLLGRVF